MNLTVIAAIIVFPVFCLAQSDNPDSLREKYFELTVKTLPPADVRLPFQKIKVIDGRADTSKLGYRFYTLLGKTSCQKVLLKPGISAGIEHFYNNYYKSNFTQNGKVLVISIRKLWIDNAPDRGITALRQNVEQPSFKDIYAKFEYYYGAEDLYKPLLRKDTIFRLTELVKINNFNAEDEGKLPFLCFSLEQLIENINYELYISKMAAKRPMSVENIISYNNEAFDIPILKEDIRKGVFITFNEFKNNRPSIINFSKRKLDNKKIEEIVDDKGLAIVQYFACYDGKKLSIRKPLSSLNRTKRNQYNQGIYRIGNSFQFFETETEVTGSRGGVRVGRNTIDVPMPMTVTTYFPRLIDMDTGDIY